MQIALFVLLGVLGLQLVGIGRSVVLIRRWRVRPDLRPQGKTGIAVHVGLPLVLSLVWALLSLAVAPTILGFPLRGLLLMDFGQVLLLSGALALVWGIMRTMLVYLVLRGRKTPPDHGASGEVRIPVEA